MVFTASMVASEIDETNFQIRETLRYNVKNSQGKVIARVVETQTTPTGGILRTNYEIYKLSNDNFFSTKNRDDAFNYAIHEA